MVKEHGATGITGIGRKFRIMDDDKSGSIDLSEFTKVIAEHARNWDPKHIKAVFDYFDKDKSGSISYDEFLVGVRGKMNDRRQQLVLEAFQVFFR
jgi:Ca2+-binding EF-hand superfamily protein